MRHLFENAKRTVELMIALGEKPKRLNSVGKVRFANANGDGVLFAYGDKVFIVQSFGRVLVIKV